MNALNSNNLKNAEKRKFNPYLLCPLCGINHVEHNGKRYIHREHIPPKNLFNNTSGLDLITVPSCRSCNAGTSRYDEIFKISTAIHGCENTEQSLWIEALKTLKHNKALKRNIEENISRLKICRDNQILIPIFIDAKQLGVSINKIIRGLHFYVTGEVIPSGVKVEYTLFQQGYSDQPNSIWGKTSEYINSGDDQFEVYYQIAKDSKYSSNWWVRIHSKNYFMGVVRNQLLTFSEYFSR